MRSIHIRNLGPIRDVDFRPGDLTILVGPQASGKSLVLQTLKAIVDVDPIVEALKLHGYHWADSPEAFVELVYGEGMRGLVGEKTHIEVDGERWDLVQKGQEVWSKRSRAEPRLFYVPAQRVLTLQEGWPRPFTAFEVGTPFVVKQFSEDLRRLLEEGPDDLRLFPAERRWKQEIRQLVANAVFHDAEVLVDSQRLRKRIVLKVPSGGPLPFLSWSAGQREFIPLMLGLYWLTPTQATSRRRHLEWVVIEEPEMGLHPAAITAVGIIALDLVKRGYKVVLSTHSPHVLELVWAVTRLRASLREHPNKLASLFGLRPTSGVREIAEAMVSKEFRVFYLAHTEDRVVSKDISDLDAESADPDVASWGGLTDLAERAAELVRESVLF